MFPKIHRQSSTLISASSDKGSSVTSTYCEAFPVKRVLLAALVLPVLGLLCGLFIVPLQIGHDAAAGLRAWINFINGGTWNTIVLPNPDNIEQTIEVAVTWWPPGQYLLLGLLNLAGLTFSHAALLLAFFSYFSGSIGSAVLARELGAPTRALPWITAVVACSSRNLAGFHGYWNGEPLIMALWPWIATIAWRLRGRSALLICTLPISFLIGSYIKYSFATYAICILLFLWSERLIGLALKSERNFGQKVGDVLKASSSLIVIGILYIIGRHYFIGSEGSPLQERGAGYSLREILAYTPIMPLTSVADFQDSIVHLVAQLSGRSYHEAWGLTASALAYVSPCFVILYTLLVAQRKPVLRFLGITALTTVGIFFVFYALGYAIGLRERYYQQAAILFLIAAAAYGVKGRSFSRLAQVFVVSVMLVGWVKFAQTTYAHLRDESIMKVGSYGFSAGFPPLLIGEAQAAAKNSNSIIAIPSPVLALEIDAVKNHSTHILPTYGHMLSSTYKGRVSQITIIEPIGYKSDLKTRFVDYPEGEWASHTVGEWIFWQTGYSANGKSEE